MREPMHASAEAGSRWALISNHGAVLVVISANPEITAREIATSLGLTERTVVRIVGDLVDAGLLVKKRTGRRNSYVVNFDARMARPDLGEIRLERFLAGLAADPRKDDQRGQQEQ